VCVCVCKNMLKTINKSKKQWEKKYKTEKRIDIQTFLFELRNLWRHGSHLSTCGLRSRGKVSSSFDTSVQYRVLLERARALCSLLCRFTHVNRWDENTDLRGKVKTNTLSPRTSEEYLLKCLEPRRRWTNSPRAHIR